jgi:hypothetical protein
MTSTKKTARKGSSTSSQFHQTLSLILEDLQSPNDELKVLGALKKCANLQSNQNGNTIFNIKFNFRYRNA